MFCQFDSFWIRSFTFVVAIFFAGNFVYAHSANDENKIESNSTTFEVASCRVLGLKHRQQSAVQLNVLGRYGNSVKHLIDVQVAIKSKDSKLVWSSEVMMGLMRLDSNLVPYQINLSRPGDFKNILFRIQKDKLSIEEESLVLGISDFKAKCKFKGF